jgi:glutaminyl-peptide cyclotransferase
MIYEAAAVMLMALALTSQVPGPMAPPVSFSGPSRESGESLPVYGYEVINTYPHDTSAFTQGLTCSDGYMYEGTGRYGESTLRKVVFESGTIIKIHHLDSQYFGEGVTIYHDTIQQLTWINQLGFIYIEGDTFECIDTFSYTTEGWGLTHNDTCLIMSDGSPVIRFLDPVTHQVIRQITVTAESVDVYYLNELEYIQGMIYANVWNRDSIAVIDPANGHVTCWINCNGILSSPPNVLNGIAFDPAGVRLFVTGKLWPALFEIKVDPINYPPQITSFFPAAPCSISSDSTLLLGITATDPDPQDSLLYAWKINGLIDTSAHTTTYSYSSAEPTIDTIVALVNDGMYKDSVIWIVYVSSPGIEQRTMTNPGFDVHIPNPCYSDVHFTYSLAVPAQVTIAIYDVTGRKTAILVDGVQHSGIHSVRSTTAMVPGIYFFHFSIGSETRKYKRVFVE